MAIGVLPEAGVVNARTGLLERYRLDPPLLLLLALLSLVGLAILYSASGQNSAVALRQGLYLLLGWVAMALAANINPYTIGRLAMPIYLLGLLALGLVLVAGVSAKGAQRWLELPGFLPRIQPSEMMKWIVPMTIAWYLSRHTQPPRPRQMIVAMALIGVPALMIAMQPDLGTAALLLITGLMVLFLAGLSFALIFSAAALALLSLPWLWQYALHEYQRERIRVMLNPEIDPLGAGWSIIQSKAAIGSGGLWGKGWLQGTQSRLDFLPEGHTDFIAAVLAEEMGLAGILLILLLYLLIVARGLFLSVRAPDGFGRLFGAALMLVFTVFVLMNMAMIAGLLPVVGAPLPLISRGGSSVVALLIGFGLLMSVCNLRGRMVI